MRILKEKEEQEAEYFLEQAIIEAKKSTCERSKCGSIIVKDNQIIGRGYNSPANQLESQRRCQNKKEDYHKKVTDKTCCIHAEQRAIINALKKNLDKLTDSILYFIRLDNNNNPQVAGKPYCTICSKLALDTGIKEFILVHEEGIKLYNTEEYNSISYEYKE
ncbi:MAG: CMP/dCMP deaminase zinc-binding protein [Parcubacteria group bacterium GW2011_GWA1_36_12]|nr:MAG: CMP/dCMP deaminase zinc-binding protein [Parcubacteria group bacterium GW2011_GWA1_36_12]